MRWKMMKEDPGVSSAQAWGCPHAPQEIFKETQASKLGDAPVHPLLYQQSSVRPSPCYIFITSYVMCYAWSVPLFTFQFVLVLLAVHNKLKHSLPCLGEKHAPLHPGTQHRFSCLFFLCVLYLFIAVVMFSSQFSCYIFLRAFIQVTFGTLLSYHSYFIQRVGLLH